MCSTFLDCLQNNLTLVSFVQFWMKAIPRNTRDGFHSKSDLRTFGKFIFLELSHDIIITYGRKLEKSFLTGIPRPRHILYSWRLWHIFESSTSSMKCLFCFFSTLLLKLFCHSFYEKINQLIDLYSFVLHECLRE